MFKIHPLLQKDCHVLGRVENSTVLLHKNALLHWFIIVPESDGKNLLELEPKLLNQVMSTAKKLNQYLIKDLNYNKTNFASIGNIVDQCHVHVVGRQPNDACWPQPVWGNLPEGPPYNNSELLNIKTTIMKKLSSSLPSI